MNEAATEPRSKRRWYQYSLRSLLIVMFLFCILFAWGGYKIRQAEKQKGIVALVKESGNDVYYNYQLIPDAVPPGPDWLRNLIGIDYFSNVEAVILFNRVSDFDLTSL